MEKAKKHNVEIILPTDYITASAFSKDAEVGYATDAQGIPDEWLGLDVGEKSTKAFNEAIKKSKTILWNGPTGVFEFPKFAEGSLSMLNACIAAAKSGTTVIVGGGDTATCTIIDKIFLLLVVIQNGKEDELSHVSTGGGASLEYIILDQN
jgi:phosphoglycerate kinase